MSKEDKRAFDGIKKEDISLQVHYQFIFIILNLLKVKMYKNKIIIHRFATEQNVPDLHTGRLASHSFLTVL